MLRGYRFFVGIGGNKEFYIDIELKKRFVQIQGFFFSKSVFCFFGITTSGGHIFRLFSFYHSETTNQTLLF